MIKAEYLFTFTGVSNECKYDGCLHGSVRRFILNTLNDIEREVSAKILRNILEQVNRGEVVTMGREGTGGRIKGREE